MLTLIQMEVSPFCDKVRRILRYKDVPFEVVDVSVVAARWHSPTGKLPVMELDGHRIEDSTQIAHFLEQRFPEPRLIPRDRHTRALCHMLEDWADESLYFYELGVHFALPENTEARLEQLLEHEAKAKRPLIKPLVSAALKRTIRAQGTGRRTPERILEDVARHAEAIEGLLDDGEYLLGNELTLADIAVFSQVRAMCEAPNVRHLFAQNRGVSAWQQRVRMKTGG